MTPDATRGPAHRGTPTDYTLAMRLSDLARDLQAEDPEQTMQGIVVAAVETIPGAAHAGISEVERRRIVRTSAATGDLVRAVDQAQYSTAEGPCLAALFEHRTVHIPDTNAESRWPTFSEKAADLGVRSILSFQLYVANDNLGALNLYAREPRAFDDESEDVGLLFAAHAAVAMADARKVQQLSHAVSVRDQIGQAKGILMERHKITGDQAFALLVRASQHANVKLVDIARYLTETGELAKPGAAR
ncbi:GAF and ANTAR domain-containing protein [Cryptosporangium phraense]|uniref:GAF and ANTAR domain-containing protein n=1 Tax=Cryptosporangium phraense TaxID=2593070 RepID=A0A545AJ14_9ACTN|nr:GAF and ANTAR domain-containing protein [Cryptosporangium phraense]TQS41314.1 GAF and ANTAR domain-containing protein [Cryptosporangium phraense]